MARSLLREAQIGDKDNMSNWEHDVEIHKNLVTSGTLNFQYGTISGTGDIYANTYYGDGSNLTGITGASGSYINQDGSTQLTGDWDFGSYTISGTGDIHCNDLYTSNNTIYIGESKIKATNKILDLYYGDVKSLSTGAFGTVKFYDEVGTDHFDIQIDTNNTAYLLNQTNSAIIEIAGRDSGGNYTILLKAHPDGSTDLYYNNNKTISTSYSGISVYDSNGTDPTIYFRDSSDIVMGYLTFSSNNFLIRTLKDSSELYLQATNASSVVKNILQGDPDGDTRLYRSGVLNLTCANNQWYFHRDGSITDGMKVYHDGATLRVTNMHHGGAFRLQSENDAGTEKILFHSDPDTGAYITYAGVKAIETVADGAQIYDTSGSTPRMYLMSSGATLLGLLRMESSYLWLNSAVDGNDLWISADNSAGSGKWVGIDSSTPSFIPSPSNSLSLGASSNVWKDVWATDTSINTSDSRLKTVISGSLGLDFINRINTVTYRWNDGTRPHQGVIAQEIKTVIDDLGIDFAGYIDPYIVDYPNGWEPTISSGTDPSPYEGESEPRLGVRYSEFIAPLIKSVQELTDIVNIQQATISGLEARIEKLEV